MSGDLLQVREAAKYLGVSRATLFTLMATGKLRWFEIEGVRGRRFKREDLDALLRERKQER